MENNNNNGVSEKPNESLKDHSQQEAEPGFKLQKNTGNWDTIRTPIGRIYLEGYIWKESRIQELEFQRSRRN